MSVHLVGRPRRQAIALPAATARQRSIRPLPRRIRCHGRECTGFSDGCETRTARRSSPDPFDPLGVLHLAGRPRQGCDPLLAAATVAGGERDGLGGPRRLALAPAGDLALRRPMPAEKPASASFGHTDHRDDVLDTRAAHQFPLAASARMNSLTSGRTRPAAAERSPPRARSSALPGPSARRTRSANGRR